MKFILFFIMVGFNISCSAQSNGIIAKDADVEMIANG